MAKICAHGKELGTIAGLCSSKRYMSDGAVLRNDGFGWKLHGKVKSGLSPQQAFDEAKRRHEANMNDRPAFVAYRNELHAMCGLSKRWKLHTAVSLMPDDCDGVWSEACDGYGDNISADVDEVGNLCRLYKVALMEAESLKPEKLVSAG